MLAKRYRLPIQNLKQARGRSYRGSFFTIKTFPSAKGFSRFGVIVSAKGSVVRNRIKRRIFNAAGLVLKKWPTADYLIITREGVGRLNQKEINGWFVSQNFS